MTGALAGRRILIVEDEYFIAVHLKRELIAAGAQVIGPVGNLAEGLAGADSDLDAAILDVNLAETLSYPIADRLRGRGIPYMFLTGYDCWSLPADYRATPCLAKPFHANALVGKLAELLRAP